MRYVVLFLLIGCTPGQIARGDDAVARYEALAKEFSATVGNNTSELEAVKEEVKALRSVVTKLEGQVGEMHKLLTVDTEISLPVPKAVDPPKVDAPPVEKADQRITLHGKPLDVAAVIKANYRVRWTHPGTIDSHLVEHGVAGFEGLDGETKEKLHSALHEMGETPVAVVKAKTKLKAAPLPVVRMPVQNCPNGRCPMQTSYYWSRRH